MLPHFSEETSLGWSFDSEDFMILHGLLILHVARCVYTRACDNKMNSQLNNTHTFTH